MSRHAKPYVKCDKRNGIYTITVMKGGPGGHALGARGTVPTGDMAALQLKVIELVEEARTPKQS